MYIQINQHPVVITLFTVRIRFNKKGNCCLMRKHVIFSIACFCTAWRFWHVKPRPSQSTKSCVKNGQKRDFDRIREQCKMTSFDLPERENVGKHGVSRTATTGKANERCIVPHDRAVHMQIIHNTCKVQICIDLSWEQSRRRTSKEKVHKLPEARTCTMPRYRFDSGTLNNAQ